MREPSRRGADRATAGALCEALGQLVSWWMLARNDFSARPVFLLADQIEVVGAARLDVPVELSARVTRLEPADPAAGQPEVVVFSAEATQESRTLLRLTDFTMSTIPIDQTEDRMETRRRWACLTSSGETREWRDQGALDLLPFMTPVEVQPGKRVTMDVMFPPETWFFATHFAKFPCVPIVMLLETLRRVTSYGLDPDGALGVDDRLDAAFVRSLKIRNFLRPGDRFQCVCDYVPVVRDGLVATRAHIVHGGKRVVGAGMEYACDGARHY